MCSQERQANFSSPTPTKTISKVVTSNMKSIPSSAGTRQSNGLFSPCHSQSSHSTRSTYHSCSDDDTVNTFATESVCGGADDELTHEIEEMQDVLSTLRMALHGFNPVKITSLPSPTPSMPSKTVVSSVTELIASQQREVEELAALQDEPFQQETDVSQDPRKRPVKSWEFLSLQNVDELDVEDEEAERQEANEATDEPDQQESDVSQDPRARAVKSWDFLSIQNIGEFDEQDDKVAKSLESRSSDSSNSATSVGRRTSTQKPPRKPRRQDNDPLGRHSDRPCLRSSAQRTANRHRVNDPLGRHSDRPSIRSEAAAKPSRPKVTDPLNMRHTDRPTIRKSAPMKKSSRSRNQDPNAIGRHSDRPSRPSRHEKDATDGSSKKKKKSSRTKDIRELMDSVTSLFSDDSENALFLDDDVLEERRKRMLEQQRRHKAALRKEEEKIRSRLDMLKAKKAARVARAASKKK